MKVVIDVYDVFHTVNEDTPIRKELRFTLVFPCEWEYEANELQIFARRNFVICNEYCSNFYAGVRAGYIALKSAYHFDGFRADIVATIED